MCFSQLVLNIFYVCCREVLSFSVCCRFQVSVLDDLCYLQPVWLVPTLLSFDVSLQVYIVRSPVSQDSTLALAFAIAAALSAVSLTLCEISPVTIAFCTLSVIDFSSMYSLIGGNSLSFSPCSTPSRDWWVAVSLLLQAFSMSVSFISLCALFPYACPILSIQVINRIYI